MKKIYFDNAATTRVKDKVVESMLPYFTEIYGNPSSVHGIGRDAKRALDTQRAAIAEMLGAKPREIFFTASGSEADNWAIKGVAGANAKKGKHIITSSIEHHAVLHTCKFLEGRGYEVTYLPVDSYGKVSVKDLEDAIRKDTILITIMHANNEIGTIQPIAEIGEIAKSKKIPFHTDAVQTVGTIPVNVNDLNVDMLSLSGHKIHAPKGIGVLYARSGRVGDNLLHGGAQESNKRAGTENIPYIVGLSTAMQMALENMELNTTRTKAMRDDIISFVMKNIDYVRLNGHPVDRLPGNVNISFEFVEGESLLLMLDMKGICASSGSACTSGSLDPSHVLLATGLTHEIAHGSVRFSLSDENTNEEVKYLKEVLPGILKTLRNISPLYNERKVR
ncbi:MAG TPA: cysteine desulfurase NifS [Clostridiales bacterium]|nr:cysteine desulfurase NifS [Clostridiales bacterium]